jgi:[acyl-carrier-protein] S-malonyltransferase
MAAIIALDETVTRGICQEAGVELANLNCPGQLVISGETEKIAKACELARQKGAKKALTVPVAGAYHSRLMASAQPKLRRALAGLTLLPPRVAVISNVTAAPHGSPAEIVEGLVNQVTSSVRWEESMPSRPGVTAHRIWPRHTLSVFRRTMTGSWLNGPTPRVWNRRQGQAVEARLRWFRY